MKYNVGDIVTGTISGVKTYGVFIKFEDTYGFCHISNCSHKYIKNLNDWFPIGSEIKAKIIDLDVQHNKINVSIKECEIQDIQEKSTNLYKHKNQHTNNKPFIYEAPHNSDNKLSFDDMLKTYLKNSEERLNCIGKRNQKHRKR